tara:strand:+ start:71 stop:307 length:237 start_codon:yes stop_codon:yes gene_type:complete
MSETKKPRTLILEYLHKLAEDFSDEKLSEIPNEELILVEYHRLKWMEAADARGKGLIDDEELIEILELAQIRYIVGSL